jgi:hypothetical protein
MKKSSPASFKRMQAVANGNGNERDHALIRAAQEAAKDFVAKIGLERLREGGELIIENPELSSDHFDLTKADYVFFKWALSYNLARSVEPAIH